MVIQKYHPLKALDVAILPASINNNQVIAGCEADKEVRAMVKMRDSINLPCEALQWPRLGFSLYASSAITRAKPLCDIVWYHIQPKIDPGQIDCLMGGFLFLCRPSIPMRSSGW